MRFFSILDWNEIKSEKNLTGNLDKFLNLKRSNLLKDELNEYFKLLFFFYTNQSANWKSFEISGEVDHFIFDKTQSYN